MREGHTYLYIHMHVLKSFDRFIMHGRGKKITISTSSVGYYQTNNIVYLIFIDWRRARK